MSNGERMEHIRNWFEKKQKVLATIPPAISETTKGKVIHRFSGKRFGYQFKDGQAWIDRKDIHLFKAYPHVIIQEQQEVNNAD